MDRGSDRHGPRVDDELDRETKSLQRGAPVESRSEEFRQQEGAGGEVAPDDEREDVAPDRRRRAEGENVSDGNEE
jgi:hypothetical protein